MTRGHSLRALLRLTLCGMAVYVAALGLYLSFAIGPAVASLQRDVRPTIRLSTWLTTRAGTLGETLVDVERMVAEGREPSAAEIASVRRRMGRQGSRAEATPFADVPPALREALARADDEAARLENRLLEVAALVELRRLSEARARLDVARVLNLEVARLLGDAQRLGLEDLERREASLAHAVKETVMVTLLWFAAAILVGGTLLMILYRRVDRPLRALERGLDAVAHGDLSVELPEGRRDELGRLTHQFNQTTALLRRRAAEQGRFAAAGQLLADVAHEVNNPLMAIGALTENRLADAALSSPVRAELEMVQKQSRRAARLVSGLLRFVRPAPEQNDAPFDADAAVRNAIELVSYQFGVESVVLETRLRADGFALGSPSKLEQVLVNLLGNAVDAMRRAEPPRLLLVESWRTERAVHVAVTDSGPGVPPELAHRLFRPFTTSKGKNGTGLGLYISRQLLRASGGELWHEATPLGARFVATLPAAACPAVSEAPRQVPPPRAGPALAGLRILLVDDEEAVRRPVAKYLTRRGATVREAADGVQALELLDEETVDVIVADLRMPRMNGAELFAELKLSRPDVAERLVFLSGDLSLAEDGGILVSPDRVLLKPVELADVERKVLEMSARVAT